MTTKSLTQSRSHRTHNQIDSDTGRNDVVDDHPLITCAPHVMEGRAHITATKMPLEAILLGLIRERGHGDLTLTDGTKVTATHVRAGVSYLVDVLVNISKIYAELGRLQQLVPHEKKSKK